MGNFYIHSIIKNNKTYIAHFADIDYFTTEHFGDNIIYTPYTKSGQLFSITKHEGGDELYNKWINFKNNVCQ